MKKFVTIIFAALIVAGTATIASAAEDFAPGENPNLQGAGAAAPRSYVPSNEAPVLSMEDYQDLNDAMGQETENGRRIPAYGSADIIVSVLPDDDEEDNVPTATTPETAVPIIENPVPAAGENAAAGNVTRATPNPHTGAADMLAPVMAAILSLSAAPVVARAKKR